jgi:hypothetical protein
MLQGGQWEGASSNACSCFLAFLLECISFDFCYCFCMLLLPSFFWCFWLTFLNVFSLISAISQFAAVIIVVKKG